MLYDRWRSIAREFANELALRDLPSERQWTFAELDAATAGRGEQHDTVFPRGNSPEFIISVLRSWRHGQIVCPLESNQAVPAITSPPAGMAHIKITSATSGPPKFILFTAEQLAADAANIVTTMGLRRELPNLAFISLAHSYGFSNLVTPLLLHGIPLVLGGAPLPEQVRSAGEQLGDITLPAVPALWRAWHDADAIPRGTRLAISAGAPLPLALERDILNTRGLKVHNFYGSSECGGIAYDASDEARSDASYAGTAMQNVQLDVNSNGCLEVRSAAVGTTYWPESQSALGAGVYVTSDLAELREGRVYLRGRASDVINVAGRKISPESIEHAIAKHPAVRECLVFGVSTEDTQRGDAIVACIVPHQQLQPEDLRQFLLHRSEAWQVPRDFWIVESLAANARGKLSRAEWRQRYLSRSGVR